jgi:hypothetical protein
LAHGPAIRFDASITSLLDIASNQKRRRKAHNVEELCAVTRAWLDAFLEDTAVTVS